MSAAIDPNAIAITAVAGRFPGAPDVETFWTNLRGGVESIHRFTDAELRAAGVSADLLRDPNYVKARPVLAEVDQFDAAFFGIPPREAEVMDPQQRLFLEIAHEALERATLVPETFAGLVGVFGATSTSSYLLHHLNGHPRAAEAGAALGTGNFADNLTTRVSYKLNLGGPAFTLQTACSGSLVAVHVAAQSLLNLECDAAVAGGVSVSLPQNTGYLYAPEGVASPDGHCRTFDARARGTIFGSGVGAVVLRRLADAQRDGDPILAVIKGSAINNDGAVKAAFTAPAVRGQAEVIAEALANAGVSAADISYVEAHGTATPLGDPIEIAALTQAFRETTDRRGYCAIGSVKTNIGHLDAAAGIAGLIKTVLALRHRELPASLHFEKPNPKIDFAQSPFVVNAALRPWSVSADGQPRRAGVSAFGVGGTNAHLILEEAPAVRVEALSPSRTRTREVLVLSARTEAALQAATARLETALGADDTPDLATVAQTLREGRRAFEHRRVVVARDAADARAALVQGDAARVATGVLKPGSREVAFLFPGQGAQAVGMGRELYATEPIFRDAFDRCAALFQPLLQRDLRAVVHSDAATPAAEAEARLQATDLAQPALFAIEWSLAEIWRAWGVEPAALLGHSLGEVTAAAVAGVLSLEDAVRMVAVRGRLMQALPRGALLAVSLPPAEVKPLLPLTVSLAIVNGPRACVVAGTPGEIARLEDTLRERGVPARVLPTSHAFQSHLMEPVVAPFLAEARQLTYHAPQIPFISNVTGRWITAAEATDPSYWARQLRQTVYFGDGMRELAKEPNRVFVEVGPGRILAGLLRPNLDAGDARSVWATLPDVRERKSEEATLFGTLGRLWMAGVPVDWRTFRGAEPTRRCALPTYAFERQRFWLEPAPPAMSATGPGERREPLERWAYTPRWKQAEWDEAEPALPANASWIVSTDAQGWGTALVERWRAEGRTVVVRAARQAWTEVLAAAIQDGRRLAGIAWHNVVDARTAEQATAAFHDGMALVQALVEHGVTDPLRMVVPTCGAQRVLRSDAVQPAGALALGLAQVLPVELPMLDVRVADFAADIDVTTAATQLADEFTQADGARLVAWRAQSRWVPHFEPLPLPEVPAAPLPSRAVVVITGGFGGVGQAIAMALARRVQARLVLVSRRGGAGQDAAVAALQRAGAEVLAVAADIATPAGWRDVFAAAQARWGRVDGIVHAAGVPGRTIAARKTPAEAAAVFAPKVDAVVALSTVLTEDGLKPEFAVLCSSLAVWSGSAGQSDYVAANAYLDAAAQVLTAAGTRAIAINWDLWSDVGMGASEAAATDLAIRPDEGGEALLRVLAAARGNVILSTARLPDRLERLQAATTAPAAGEASAAGPRYPRPALTTEYVAPAAGLEATLAAQWAQVLGLEQVGADDNFFELGGDSLTAMQAIAALRRDPGVSLAVTVFYDQPTPRGLAPLVAAERAAARGDATS